MDPKFITAFIKSGELVAMNVATCRDQRPRYLIDRADIEDFEHARQVVPDSGKPAPRRRRAQPGVTEFF